MLVTMQTTPAPPDHPARLEHRSGAFARRIEEASLNAWPALQQQLYDGWLLRFGRGFTKRANSVVPLYDGSLPIVQKVDYCERLYRREQQQTIFRLTTIVDHKNLPDVLAERRYTPIDETDVLVAPADSIDGKRAPGFVETACEDWLRAYSALNAMPEHAQPLHRAILSAIKSPCGYGLIHANGQIVACGLAVADQEVAGVFDVVVHPDFRRRGYGHALIAGLARWARAHHAAHVYLQVLASNAPAQSLYRALGFQRLYAYHYLTPTP